MLVWIYIHTHAHITFIYTYVFVYITKILQPPQPQQKGIDDDNVKKEACRQKQYEKFNMYRIE